MTALSQVSTDAIPSDVVCRVTGATYRQVDSWVTMGYATVSDAPGGPGHPRGFDFSDVVRIAALRRLGDLGVPPSVAAPLLTEVDADLVVLSEGVVHQVTGEMVTRLLGSGRAVVGISPSAVAAEIGSLLAGLGHSPTVYGDDWWDELGVVYGGGCPDE